ncbi:unnamed protein product [Ilex paraguariensis]|uniref:Uncharacterized protein n=1 Tax=Ilex paraguariensis TaxID=185542 RepID=A0ABC8S4W2_9AQUA
MNSSCCICLSKSKQNHSQSSHSNTQQSCASETTWMLGSSCIEKGWMEAANAGGLGKRGLTEEVELLSLSLIFFL